MKKMLNWLLILKINWLVWSVYVGIYCEASKDVLESGNAGQWLAKQQVSSVMDLSGKSASDTNIPVVIHVVLDKNGKQIINTESTNVISYEPSLKLNTQSLVKSIPESVCDTSKYLITDEKMWDGNLLKTVENGTFIECCRSCNTTSGCKGWEWQTWGGRTICSWYDSLNGFAIKPWWAYNKTYQCITTTKVLAYQVSNVRYDIQNATVHTQPPQTLIKLTVENQGDIPQIFRQKRVVSTSQSFSLSFTRGVKAGVKTSFKAGVPFFAETTVEVSIEANFELESVDSFTKTEEIDVELEMTVPPKSIGIATFVVFYVKININYTADLVTVFADGTSITENQERGIFTGISVHETRAIYYPPIPFNITSTVR